MLIHDPQVNGELLHDRDTNAGADGEAKAKILALGVGCAGGMGEDETDARFKVGNDGPIGLDEVVARAEKPAGKPWVGSLQGGTEHAAEEKFGIATIPAVVANFIQLPANGDELGEVNIVVGVVDRKKSGGFGRERDDIFAKEGFLGRFGLGNLGQRRYAGLLGRHLRPTTCY